MKGLNKYLCQLPFCKLQHGVGNEASEASVPFAPTTPPKGFLHITPIGVFRQKKIIFFSQGG